MFHAALECLSGPRLYLMFLLGAGMICATVLCAAQAPAAKAPNAPAAHADFVGSDTCASCHEEVSKKFSSNPHTRMALMPGNHARSEERRVGKEC